MTLDERLQRAVDGIGDRLREDLTRELSSLNLTPATDDAAVARLADALRAIDRARSLTEILETLAALAEAEASRSGVYLSSGGRMRSFRVSGLPDDFDRMPADVKAAGVPLTLAGTQVGAVYADGADKLTLEILVRFASRALESLTALKTARAVAEGQLS
jgi:hypothetical protein